MPANQKKINQSRLLAKQLLIALLACLTFSAAWAALEISPELLARIESKYGAAAGERIRNWQQLMETSKNLLEEEKLKAVNDFFNRLEFVEDLKKWGIQDYWATPFEFLAVNGGDCEDFSIAKYFTLMEIGVPEEKLRLTYVKALQYNQSHMVLTYFSSPTATPLVLDNLNPQILPASQRDDLVPVYSFNGSGLWLAKSIGSGKQVGNPDGLNPWQDLKTRMQLKGADIQIK